MSEEENKSNEIKLKTPFGILEDVYMRLAKQQGNYTPTVHELLALVTKGLISYNESRVLFYIFEKTIYFRETHRRFKRKEIYEALKISKPKFYDAKNSLLEKELLLESYDKDDYYFYGLNPFKFNGLIVVRSYQDGFESINRAHKKSLGILSGTKKTSKKYQAGINLVTKRYPEDKLSICNLSDFEILKYTLQKYTLQNGLTALAGERIIKIFEEAKNPPYLMLQFVKILHKNPSAARGMYEELQRAHKTRRDIEGRPIYNVPGYLITNWESVKTHWQNIDHKVDMSPEAKELRNELYEVIQSYPIENNIFPLRKLN